MPRLPTVPGSATVEKPCVRVTAGHPAWLNAGGRCETFQGEAGEEEGGHHEVLQYQVEFDCGTHHFISLLLGGRGSVTGMEKELEHRQGKGETN